MSSPDTPLWSAGHLPRKGGDWLSPRASPIADVAGRAPSLTLPISPLAGEMPGRAEGGASHCHSFILEPVG
ncbi:lytic murein transglycosylase [Mesorhizobium sp. WSM4313]|nr:lytic murein transglycosylase [Mesorhizobium sp. WSM4313]